MASSFTFKTLPQTQLQLSSFSHCNYSSTLDTTFRFVLSLDSLNGSTSKRTLRIQCKLGVASRSGTRLAEGRAEQISRNNVNNGSSEDFLSGFPPSTHIGKRESGKPLERNHVGSEEPTERRRVILKDRNAKAGSNSNGRKVFGSDISSRKVKYKNLASNTDKTSTVKVLNDEVDVEDGKKRNKKAKVTPLGDTLRIGLDMCSKRGHVMNAIRLYDLAKKEGIKLKQYHYAVLLYLCSSAALGMVQPAKSGSQGRSLSHVEPSQENTVVGSESLNEFAEMIKRIDPKPNVSKHNLDMEPVIGLVEKTKYKIGPIPVEEKGDGSRYEEEDLRDLVKGSMEVYPKTLDGLVQHIKKSSNYLNTKHDRGNGGGIQVSENLKRIAVRKGLEIYNEMHLKNIPMNEAIFTSVARMAMAFADGDLAFEMVKKMKTYGIDPRLRSYGPALAIFCGTGDVGNAFTVEKHMMEHGVHPEEPELQALLKVSVEAGNSEKVYYILHKLRSRVRQVSPATADSIEMWFASNIASKVGKTKWDHELINKAMSSGGGGWHGKGWLGKGKWTVHRSSVSSDGFCNICGEKLVTIDLDPAETESFAQSVASIASQREKNSSFQKFQKWLEYYGPFEAVVDAANVGLYSQRSFKPSKVNAVANGIRQMLPSRKWPLIVLHNRRIVGEKMDEPFNKTLIEKWKNADALYATPTGSNDDWYWLYAAIKYRCLVVTNDEMRDHLFQVLGNVFFPKWKERHQVHFSFNETGPVFRMPPPCSIVIQESDKGHWHIPIESEVGSEDARIWLCCTRQKATSSVQDCSDVRKESHLSSRKMKRSRSKCQAEEAKLLRQSNNADHCMQELEDSSASVRSLVSSSAFEGNYASILPQLEAAEESGSGLIDFQI